MVVTNMCSQNEFAIVKNKELQMFQEVDYESIKSEYSELLDLCDILSRNENEEKKLALSYKKEF